MIRREYGDLILWYQIIDHASTAKISHLILVTDDQKEDWWWKIDSGGPKTIGPRAELIDELMEKAGVSSFYQYNSENFLRYARQYLKIDVGEESIRQVQETRELERNESMPRDATMTTRGTLRLGMSDYKWDGWGDWYSSSIGIFTEGGLSGESLMEVRGIRASITVLGTLNNAVPGSNADISIAFFSQDRGGHYAWFGVIPAGSPAGTYPFVLDAGNIDFIKQEIQHLDRVIVSTNGATSPPDSVDWHGEFQFFK
jgi:hypothetical protein